MECVDMLIEWWMNVLNWMIHNTMWGIWWWLGQEWIWFEVNEMKSVIWLNWFYDIGMMELSDDEFKEGEREPWI